MPGYESGHLFFINHPTHYATDIAGSSAGNNCEAYFYRKL